MTSLGEGLPAEIARVTEIKELYASMRGTPWLNVEPAIANMGEAIADAVQAASDGDVVAMLRAYVRLRGFDV